MKNKLTSMSSQTSQLDPYADEIVKNKGQSNLIDGRETINSQSNLFQPEEENNEIEFKCFYGEAMCDCLKHQRDLLRP